MPTPTLLRAHRDGELGELECQRHAARPISRHHAKSTQAPGTGSAAVNVNEVLDGERRTEGRRSALGLGTILHVTATVAAGHVRLIRTRPLLVAGAVSVVTAVILVVWLAMAGTLIALIGCSLAFWATSYHRAVLASRLVSIGLGLCVGPALYVGLWAMTSAAS